MSSWKMGSCILWLFLFWFQPSSGEAFAQERSGLKLLPSVTLTSALAVVTVSSVFIPKPPRAFSRGANFLDVPLQNALEQPTLELRSNYIGYGDLGLALSLGIPLISFAAVGIASSSHRNPAQLNRFLIGSQALFSNLLFILISKAWVARERPDATQGNDSFPCGHCAAAFAPAFLMFSPASPFATNDLKVWRYSVGTVAMAAAVTTSTLRMASGQHYFTDALAGLGLGFLFGFIYPTLVENGEVHILPEGGAKIGLRLELP